MNVSHLDQVLLGVHVKEKPPVADASAKGGRLALQLHDVPGERSCAISSRSRSPAKALREAHEHHEALAFFLFLGASSASIASFAEENGPEVRPLRKS